jgi:hypothetical protein
MLGRRFGGLYEKRRAGGGLGLICVDFGRFFLTLLP